MVELLLFEICKPNDLTSTAYALTFAILLSFDIGANKTLVALLPKSNLAPISNDICILYNVNSLFSSNIPRLAQDFQMRSIDQ